MDLEDDVVVANNGINDEIVRSRKVIDGYFESMNNEGGWSVNHKSGMDKEAHDKAKQIIEESSKNSDFYKSEEKKLESVRDKVAKYKERVETTKMDKGLWERFEMNVEKKMPKL